MFFTYAYLLRVPVICGLIMAAFPFLALPSEPGTASLLGGMFDLQFWRIAVVSAIAVLLAFACTITSDNILTFGHLRFSVRPLPVWWGDYVFYRHWFQLQRRTAAVLAFYAVCAASLCIGLLIGSHRNGSRWGGCGVPLGIAAAIAFAAWVRIFWRDRPEGFVASTLTWVFQWTRDGYLDNNGQIFHSHAAAAVAALLSLAVYALFGISKYLAILGWPYAPPKTDNNPLVPTLGCVLLLLMMLCWFFAGLSFLLDRYRVPSLVLFAVMVWYTGSWSEADHTFPVYAIPGPPSKLLPSDLLRNSGNRVILIAASGGGIQASAWMARVLGGLSEYLDSSGLAGQFAKSIRVVSAVSGGSMGAMYFIHAYENGSLPPTSQLNEKLYDPSQRSSLDEVAWGLVYPDFLRVFVPILPWPDRGWAIEDAWKAAINGAALNQPLSSWRDDVKNARRPAVFFNTTLVDTGAKVVFSTADFAPDGPGGQSFYDPTLFPNSDVSIATAARLSATFPYVLPAARVAGNETKSLRYHFVDGGYYDNFGIATLERWLDQALPSLAGRRVLLIQIVGPLPTGEGQASGGQGFFFQTAAPLETLYNFRGTAQMQHNQNELRLLTDFAATQGVSLTTVVFDWPPGEDSPLSWHLTPPQKARIVSTFNACFQSQKEQVREFLK